MANLKWIETQSIPCPSYKTIRVNKNSCRIKSVNLLFFRSFIDNHQWVGNIFISDPKDIWAVKISC